MGGKSVHHRPGVVKFEKRAVAFIDILGFKALVEEAAICVEASGRLSRLVKVLETAVPALNCKVKKDAAYLIPDHIYISDCIILSAPLEDESRKDYSGLDAVVMRVIQLSHVFLDAGYIIRGGVAIGDVWHFKNNIVGPAYQEALDIEKNLAKAPRVVLSQRAAQCWCNRYGMGDSRMCLMDEDGQMIVNGLHGFYIPNNDKYGVIELAYEKYAEIADAMLKKFKKNKSVRKKWKFLKKFISIELKH